MPAVVVVAAILLLAFATGCGGGGNATPPVVPGLDAPPGGGADPAAAAAPPVTSPIALLDDLPENARPKAIDDTIRLDRANDWLAATAPGKRIAWDYAIADIGLARQGKTRYYTVSIYPAPPGERKLNVHRLHGLDWTLRIFNTVDRFDIPNVLDDTADRLTPLRNSTVTIVAEIESASLGGGTLWVEVRDLQIAGVPTGLRAALAELQQATDEERPERIDILLRAIGKQAAAGRPALGLLVPLLGHAKPETRQAAAIAVLAIDPTHAAALPLLPKQASLNGKYAGLLRILHQPEDRSSYTAEVYDSGRSAAYPDYRGHKEIPAGYWVYFPPNWYIWEREAGLPPEATKTGE